MSPKEELIKYRRIKAAETLKDATILLSHGSLNSAVNRIYYALFYEVTALLLTRDYSSSRHSGIKSLFNERFIKTGIVTVETGRFFSTMFEFRQKGDYSDYNNFEREKVDEWLDRAKSCIDEIEGLFAEQEI